LECYTGVGWTELLVESFEDCLLGDSFVQVGQASIWFELDIQCCGKRKWWARLRLYRALVAKSAINFFKNKNSKHRKNRKEFKK